MKRGDERGRRWGRVEERRGKRTEIEGMGEKRKEKMRGEEEKREKEDKSGAEEFVHIRWV